MSETPQTTLTAITLKVGKLAAYKAIGDKLEELLPPVKEYKVSALKVLEEILDFIIEEMEKLENE